MVTKKGQQNLCLIIQIKSCLNAESIYIVYSRDLFEWYWIEFYYTFYVLTEREIKRVKCKYSFQNYGIVLLILLQDLQNVKGTYRLIYETINFSYLPTNPDITVQ